MKSNPIMQYSKMILPDALALSCEEIGIELENGLEKLGFRVTIPSSTDWGYVFRIKSNGQKIDIFVTLLEGGFGLAIEPEKGLFPTISRYFTKPDTAIIKARIEEILTIELGAKIDKWYSANEWAVAFGSTFWKWPQ